MVSSASEESKNLFDVGKSMNKCSTYVLLIVTLSRQNFFQDFLKEGSFQL